MSDEKDIPAIPRAGLDSTVWQRLEAMREAIQKLIGTRGRDGDAAVRWADLAADGVGDVRRRTVTITDRVSELVQGGSSGGTGGGYEPDLTKPPTPTGLTVAAGFSNLLIEWTAPSYTAGHGNKFTHIYATKQAAASSTLYTFDDAVEINQVPGAASLCAHPSDLGVKWRIWIKFESNDGQFSDPHGGVNGFVVTTGKVGTSDLNDAIIEAAKLADGSISADKFNSGIEPVTIVSAVPGAKVTNTIFNTADGKLYRWSGAAYVKTIPTADLTGTVTDAQIAGMAASKVTGTLTDSQLAAIAAAKVTGQIVGTQITDGAVTTDKLFAGSVTTAKIAADAVTSTEIAAGAVTASEIAAGAVTTAKLAAGAVTANEIAAGAVVAGKVAANAITATELAADSVTAGKVAAGAITTSKLFVSGAGAALNADPSGMDSTAWTNSPVMLTGQSDMPAGSTAIANTTGAGKDVLTAELIPIEQLKRYRVEALVKQTVGSTGTMYLGVAWYDANKNLLTSNAAQPGGAGSPAGWSNGTYSYFGLIGAAAPATWTRYVTSFGPNESKAIPTNAKYIKLVALLNYGGTAGVQHAVSGFKLMEKADADLIVDGAIVASKLAANAIAVGTAAVQNGAIVNAMIGTAAIDDAKVASLSAAKLTAGDGTIGGDLKSTNFVSGSTGWRVRPDGSAEFSNIIIRGATYTGTIYASAGTIGGITIASTYLRAGQLGFDNGTGFYFGSDGRFSFGNSSGSKITWDNSTLNVSANLVGATGTFSGSLSGATGTFAGSLSAATGTFAGSLSAATGTFSGTMTAAAVNAVNTINIAGYAVIVPTAAEWSGSVSSGVGTIVSAPAIDSEGGNVAISVSVQFSVTSIPIGAQTWAYIRLIRDGTVIREFFEGIHERNSGDSSGTFIFMDSPAAGSHIYGVAVRGYVTTNGNENGATVKYVGLMAIGAKR